MRASENSSYPKVSRTKKFAIDSPGCRLNPRYCWRIAAVFGNVFRTNGEPANFFKRFRVPSGESNSVLDHDIARRRAGPDSLEINLEATYLRFLVGVDATNHATSFVYLRQFFACPSHEGTLSSLRVAIAARCRLWGKSWSSGSSQSPLRLHEVKLKEKVPKWKLKLVQKVQGCRSAKGPPLLRHRPRSQRLGRLAAGS